MKNFFYNLSDILLTALIVAVCAGVIFWRMQIILDYPEQVASKAHQNEVEATADTADTTDSADTADTQEAPEGSVG